MWVGPTGDVSGQDVRDPSEPRMALKRAPEGPTRSAAIGYHHSRRIHTDFALCS